MRSVNTNAERQLRATIHDRPQVFEAVTDAFALPRSVLQQNSQLSKSQAFARDLQTQCTNLERILFRTATRAARMYDEIINTERYRSLNLFTKRVNRFQQNDFVSSGKIDQVIRVNQNWRDSGLLSRLAEESNRFVGQRLGFPSARIARKELNGIAAKLVSQEEALMKAVLDGKMRAYARTSLD